MDWLRWAVFAASGERKSWPALSSWWSFACWALRTTSACCLRSARENHCGTSCGLRGWTSARSWPLSLLLRPSFSWDGSPFWPIRCSWAEMRGLSQLLAYLHLSSNSQLLSKAHAVLLLFLPEFRSTSCLLLFFTEQSTRNPWPSREWMFYGSMTFWIPLVQLTCPAWCTGFYCFRRENCAVLEPWGHAIFWVFCKCSSGKGLLCWFPADWENSAREGRSCLL